MLSGLISVGLFWGILLYYVNQGMQGQSILPLIKSALPNKERILRYLRNRKKRSPTKQINQEDSKSESEIIQNQSGVDSFSVQKSLLKQMSEIKSDSNLAKTKQITKHRKKKMTKQKQIRRWVTKLGGFNNKEQVDGKNSFSQNDPNSKKNVESPLDQKLSNSMILNDSSFDDQDQYENSNILPQNVVTQKKNQRDNSFQFGPQPK